ncbi:MAG: hypothetical protein ACOVO3_01335 [Fluviicola sp.]
MSKYRKLGPLNGNKALFFKDPLDTVPRDWDLTDVLAYNFIKESTGLVGFCVDFVSTDDWVGSS